MIGILLINLGTPDAPDAAAVRRYLAEFLGDPRVVEIPAIAWKPILYGIILPTRPRRSAEAYRQIWTNEGSPLAAIARRQTVELQSRLGDDVMVEQAMRYGNPGIAGAIKRMIQAGCDRILAAPLYPQYCAATTATANDAVFATLAKLRAQPALRTLPPYFDDPLYIDALRANLERQIEALDFEPQRLLLSFHGVPERTIALGDPYKSHCEATARMLAQALGGDVDVAYQSRFGRAKWLGPATDATLAAYPGQDITRVAVAAPGFSVDCLETLEELGIRERSSFLAGGGDKFGLLDCLNDSPEGMDMLEALIRRELEGWLPPA